LIKSKRFKESGAVSIEYALIFPSLLIIVLLLVQSILWLFADRTAQAAAEHGSDAAAAYQARLSDGKNAAEDALDKLPGLKRSTINAFTDGDSVTVVVEGEPVSILPLGLKIKAESTSAIERFYEVGDRQ